MPETPVILQVIPRLDTGGAERTVIEVAEAVTRAGGKVLVVAAGGRLTGELEAAGGELIPFPADAKKPLTILANARRLERLIAARGVSLVHARSRAPAWSALIAARRARVPFVTTYHGVYNQRSAIKGWYNSVMARGDEVIANSHYTAKIVAARHGIPENRLTVIHRGVDLARFDPAGVSAERVGALRAAWHVGPQTRLVVQAARLTRWKGQHVMVGAAAHLKDDPEFGDVVFILAGDDQGRTAYAQELAGRIKTLGLEGRVRLTGHCDDVPAAFLTAALGVVPSIEPEAFGRASAEAQAMGCPVIVSDLGALPETLGQCGGGAAQQPTGWIVPPGDETALAERIAAILRMPAASLAAMRDAARGHVAAHFSKTALQSRNLLIYDRLLGTSLTEAFREVSQSVDFMPAYNTNSTQSI